MCLRFQFCTHHRVCILHFLKKRQIRCTLLCMFVTFSYRAGVQTSVNNHDWTDTADAKNFGTQRIQFLCISLPEGDPLPGGLQDPLVYRELLHKPPVGLHDAPRPFHMAHRITFHHKQESYNFSVSLQLRSSTVVKKK